MRIVLYGEDRLRREVSDDVLEGKEVEALRAFVRYG